jgi:hypothetical protein
MVPSHPYALLQCDACRQLIDADTASSGLLVFPRGDEVVYEEPPLCSRCSLAIGMTAMVRWAEEEEEG